MDSAKANDENGEAAEVVRVHAELIDTRSPVRIRWHELHGFVQVTIGGTQRFDIEGSIGKILQLNASTLLATRVFGRSVEWRINRSHERHPFLPL